MKMLEFEESGMLFAFAESECFRIEKSSLYDSVNRGSDKNEGVKIAEFLLMRNKTHHEDQIWVIEAKSSSPRPETQPGFDGFIAEIREKLVNAFSLYIAACLNRHSEADKELPASFRNIHLTKTNVRFFLVINGHKESWLPPLQEALSKALRVTIKIWGLSPTSVAVINDEMAKSKTYGLIRVAQAGTARDEDRNV
jgi:hypothetical protein